MLNLIYDKIKLRNNRRGGVVMKLKKMLAVTAVGLLSVGFLAACGKSDKKASDTDKKVTTVTIAQTADSKPYAYKDGDNLTGFDI